MSLTRQQLRATERLKKKEEDSSEKAKARAKHRSEWKERWDNRLAIQRTPWQKFVFFLPILLRALGWQYCVWKRLANSEHSSERKIS
jgi:hypothetical protein